MRRSHRARAVVVVSAHVVAFGAISALGEGSSALGVAPVGGAARIAVARDAELAGAGLDRPFAARVPNVAADARDRAAALLAHALRACAADLDRTRPGWREERVGLALGTSSGGMCGAEEVFRARSAGVPVTRDAARSATYFAPLDVVLDALAVARLEPATLVLTACAASTLALGLGARWLERDACDLVLAGGFDAISVFVASGFEVLRATTTAPPARSFGRGRDGMSVGEGAAVMALARDPRGAPVLAAVQGFGASSDATHLTAPHPEGDGLRRAATRALEEAAIDRAEIGFVSGHATATPFNDAAEARAIGALLPATSRHVHPLKAQIGHTMGAAGALEALACVEALARGVVPAAASYAHVEPELGVELAARSTEVAPRAALKLSAAFGGANAALVIGRGGSSVRPASTAAPRTPRRSAFVGRAVHVDRAPDLPTLSELLGTTVERLAKTDGLSRLALHAVHRLAGVEGPLRGAGIVVGHAFATLETNAAYFARVIERGPSKGEPRRFPATTPHAVAGECSIAFGLDGPGIAVGAGTHGGVEALLTAVDLVAAGDAERVVVVAVDDTGDTVREVARAVDVEAPPSGAVALLVSAASLGYARAGAPSSGVRRAEVPSASPASVAAGHVALLPLVHATPPSEVRATSRWGLDAWAGLALEQDLA